MTRDVLNRNAIFLSSHCVAEFEADAFTHIFGDERGTGELKTPAISEKRRGTEKFTLNLGHDPESGRELFVRAYYGEKNVAMIAFDTVTSYQYSEVAQRVNSQPSPQNGWRQEGRVLPSPYDTPEICAAIAKWMKTIEFYLGKYAG